MKKLILAIVGLAFAFAISSCCDQAQCPKNKKCDIQNGGNEESCLPEDQTYRFEQTESDQAPAAERPHRRW